MPQDWSSFSFGWDTGYFGLFMVNIIMMLEFLRKIRWEQPSLPASTWSFQKLGSFLKVFSLHDPCAVGSDLLATPSAVWSLNEQLVKQFHCFNVILMIVTAALKARVVKSNWILHKAATASFSCASDQPEREAHHPQPHQLLAIQCCNRCTFTLQLKLL